MRWAGFKTSALEAKEDVTVVAQPAKETLLISWRQLQINKVRFIYDTAVAYIHTFNYILFGTIGWLK